MIGKSWLMNATCRTMFDKFDRRVSLARDTSHCTRLHHLSYTLVTSLMRGTFSRLLFCVARESPGEKFRDVCPRQLYKQAAITPSSCQEISVYLRLFANVVSRSVANFASPELARRELYNINNEAARTAVIICRILLSVLPPYRPPTI